MLVLHAWSERVKETSFPMQRLARLQRHRHLHRPYLDITQQLYLLTGQPALLLEGPV